MPTQLLDTTSKHSWSIVALADAAFHHAKEVTFKSSWSPLAKVAEAAVVSLMERIEQGQLRIVTPSHVYIFPRPGSIADKCNAKPDLKAELRILKESAWIRICTMSDLGFAEAYMYGEASCEDLLSLFKMFIYNREAIAGLNSTASYLFSIPSRLTSYRFVNTISNSKSNISAHYDISNAMFEGFLSKDMTYSCAIFSELDSDLNITECKDLWSSSPSNVFRHIPLQDRDSPSPPPTPSTSPPEYTTDDLYSAQMRKIRHIINKAQILPGHRVLEIGSGWGSMAIAIAKFIPDTQIDSITLSIAQRDLALKRVFREGLQDRIRIHLMDYRAMPAGWKNAFDRMVSVEMLEAVGQEFLSIFWEKVEWALKPRNSVGVVQCITMPEPRFARYCKEIDFIKKWSKLFKSIIFPLTQFLPVFPGCFIPSLSCILEGLSAGARSQLVVDSITNIGPHYARTLREWRNSFVEKFDTVIEPALRNEYPYIMDSENGKEEIEVFRRKWIYYYSYCEVGFSTRMLGDHIITFSRDGTEDYGCQVFE